MITVVQIEDSIDLAEAYYLQLLSVDTTMLQNGGRAVNSGRIECLNKLIRALTWDVNINYVGSNTVILYNLLLKAISTYSGAALPFDPNSYIPGNNNTITITFEMPPPVEITYGSMTLSGTRYDNTLWKGLNPFMVVDNTTWLENGVDYTLLPTGGFILSAGGNMPAIYAGQTIRALNYQPMFAGAISTDIDTADVTVATYADMIALGTPTSTLRVRVLVDENVGGTNTRYVKYSDGTISFDN